MEAYISTHLLNFAQKPRRRIQGYAGVDEDSSLQSTLAIYTQAVGPAKRAAQASVLSLFVPSGYSKGSDEIIGTA